jgi:hypothetical protein
MLKLFAEIADRLPDSQDRGEMSDFPKKSLGKTVKSAILYQRVNYFGKKQ